MVCTYVNNNSCTFNSHLLCGLEILGPAQENFSYLLIEAEFIYKFLQQFLYECISIFYFDSKHTKADVK